MDVDQINIVQLSSILKQRETDIIEGRQKLSLTASLLQKLNYALQVLEYDHVSLSNNTAIPDEPIRFLQDLVHKTPKLTVTQRIKRETWRVDISRFNNLRYLELSRIPMHLVEGMHSVHSKLQVLICERCTDCLEEILGTSDYMWEELRTAKLCYNDFALLCPFNNTPWLQYLDLSYNKIEDRLSLQTLTNLKYLNLSFNFLTSVPMLSEEVCHKLKVLLINNNYIQDLLAISVFDSLEILDVSNNLLAEHSAISPILCLPNLRSLNLVSNPISYHPHHRFHTCSYLNKGVIPDEFILDGTLLNILEQKEIGRRGETQRYFGIARSRDLSCLPSGSLNQNSPRIVPKKKVRDVVIEEASSNQHTPPAVKPIESNQEHLQTKKQIEELRERFGGDHWLHSHAGSYIQDIMGLQKPSDSGLNISTALGQDLLPPPSTSLLPSINNKADSSSSTRFDSSASDDYVTALTTQAIIEKIPHDSVASTSETSDSDQPILAKEFQTTAEPPDVIKDEIQNKLSETERSSDEFSSEDKNQLIKEEPEENEDGQLWLVQKSKGDGVLVELFLILTEKEIREKCTNTGRTTTKWNLESVESCEKINSEPPTIHITFKTIRKAFRERTYIMEYADAQEFLKRVRSFLEAQSLAAMQQVAYRCMKCSSMFSIETQPYVLSASLLENGPVDGKSVAKCPTCRSSLVVQMDEPPLPSTEKGMEELSSPKSPLHHSPSDCSIGSAASLEQGMGVDPPGGSVKEGTPTPRRCDSDIEVISNPSQSSIEILEVQARLQGNLTPSRKRSNEERSLVAVPQLNTVPEVHPSLTGLTESSSSGSLTDSVCTAYESNPVPVRRVGMSDVPEETTPTPTSTIIYNSLLEGLIQNVTSKLTPMKSSSVDSTFNVRYSYEDFSQVDHRIKLYLYQETFKHDNEELLFLLRAQLVVLSEEPVPGCLVVSSHSVYILQIISSEVGEDASEWFQLTISHRLAEMTTIFALPWDLGAGFCLGSSVYLALFNDVEHTCNFFKYLDSLSQQGSTFLQNVNIEEQPSTKSEKMLRQLVLCTVAACDGPVDCAVRHFALCAPVHTTRNSEEILNLPLAPLLVTSTDLLLLKPNFSWLLPSTEPSPQSAASQKLANIIDISLDGLQLQLQYLKEPENREEVWNLGLSSIEAVNLIIESIRGPWEQLFSVPLQLAIKH